VDGDSTSPSGISLSAQIALIVVGCAIGVALIVVILIFVVQRMKKSGNSSRPVVEMETTAAPTPASAVVVQHQLSAPAAPTSAVFVQQYAQPVQVVQTIQTIQTVQTIQPGQVVHTVYQ